MRKLGSVILSSHISPWTVSAFTVELEFPDKDLVSKSSKSAGYNVSEPII